MTTIMLAALSDLTPVTIERWESGDTTDPALDAATRAANALGVSLDFLVGLENGEAA